MSIETPEIYIESINCVIFLILNEVNPWGLCLVIGCDQN
jgi:hypothetical protein